jgi:hypothetical protein
MIEDDIQYILNIEIFTNIVLDQSWDLFVDKCLTNIPAEFNGKYTKEEKCINISQDIIDSEIEKFVIIDERESNKGFILKDNVFRLLHSLSNEMISRYLNDLVDSGELNLCWDSKKHEFIWLPNKEK